MIKPLVNIVMLTRDRPTLLCQTIESLISSTLVKGGLDVNLTILDDGSGPQALSYLCSLSLVLQFSLKKNIAVVTADKCCFKAHLLGALKHEAVNHSKRIFDVPQFLCLIDNDVFFKHLWLDKMIAMANGSEEDGFVLWGGQNHPLHPFMPSCVKHDLLGMREVDTLAGTHMFMRWETWATYGSSMISEGPGVCRGEDVAFCAAIKASGAAIGVSVPEVVIDCGLTQTGGTPSPGIELKRARMVPGVIYE